MVASSATADTDPASWWFGRGQRAVNTSLVSYGYDNEMVDGWLTNGSKGLATANTSPVRYAYDLDGQKFGTSSVGW